LSISATGFESKEPPRENAFYPAGSFYIGRSAAPACGLEQVAGKLVDRELIEREVPVEGSNHQGR